MPTLDTTIRWARRTRTRRRARRRTARTTSSCGTARQMPDGRPDPFARRSRVRPPCRRRRSPGRSRRTRPARRVTPRCTRARAPIATRRRHADHGSGRLGEPDVQRAVGSRSSAGTSAFVQISTDGGATYTSIPCTDTTTDHDPGAVAEVVEKLPGFTGVSGGTGVWTPQTCSLVGLCGPDRAARLPHRSRPGGRGQRRARPVRLLGRRRHRRWDARLRRLVAGAVQVALETRPTAVSNFTVTLLSIDSKSKKITVKRFRSPAIRRQRAGERAEVHRQEGRLRRR